MDRATERGPLVPVLLAGGSGTRLWPVSRVAFPKHLVELVGEESLLQATARRVLRAAPAEHVVTIAAAGQAVLVRRQLAEIDGALLRHLLLEPEPRNTAAAVGLAARHTAARIAANAILWVCPSDHLIRAPGVLLDALERALRLAAAGRIVTFGIAPSRPETGFGWIARGEPLEVPGAFTVRRFVEKPPRAEAEAMLAAGGHDWNSGMFVMRADVLLDELGRFEPDLARDLEALEASHRTNADGVLDAGLFARLPSLPIDKAVMERSARMAVVPCDPGWSDVGSWHALWELMGKDEHGNVAVGDVALAGAHDNLVKADHRLVALAGVRGLAVIETADAILVADRTDGVHDAVRIVRPEQNLRIVRVGQQNRPAVGLDDETAGQRKRLRVSRFALEAIVASVTEPRDAVRFGTTARVVPVRHFRRRAPEPDQPVHEVRGGDHQHAPTRRGPCEVVGGQRRPPSDGSELMNEPADATEVVPIQQRLQKAQVRAETRDVPRRHQDAVRSAGVGDRAPVVQTGGERLLDEHGNATGDALECDRHVRVIRCCHDGRVDPPDDFAHVLRQQRRQPEAPRQACDPLPHRVDQRDDLDGRALQRGRQMSRLGDHSSADNGESDWF